MIRTGETAAIRFAAILTVAALAAGCSTTAGTGAAGDANYLAKAETEEETLICKRERPTGSRISEKICLTAEDWEKIERQSREMLDRTTRKAQQYEDQ
jgi:hypothetical protein